MTIDEWIQGFKKAKTDQKSSYSKDELRDKLLEMKGQGWIVLSAKRRGKDGGLGNTLEDVLGIPENNIPLADYGQFELKTHRSRSNSLISLFRSEPKPERRVPFLVENYGWPIPKYGPREKSLRVDMDAAKFSERGFIVAVNEKMKRVEVHFDSSKVPEREPYQEWLEGVEKRVGLGDLDPIPYWTYEVLEGKVQEKIRNMVYVRAETGSKSGKQTMKIMDALLLQGAGLSRLLIGLQEGWFQIEFSARTHHNHGTAFRTWERNWPKLYTQMEKLL